MIRTSPRDPRLIYARTPAGDHEMTALALELDHAARRILALVDARRSVGDLSRLARPGELGPMLSALERHGLIEEIALAPEATEAQRRERERAEQARLHAAKETLHGAFATELGTAGRIWDARVADSVSLEVLRRVVREAIDVVQRRCDEAAAQRTLALVRPLFARER